jgi:predicted nucleic acid-binding protein
MTPIVVDASVILQWVLASPGTEQALALLQARHRMAVPDLVQREFEGVLKDAERLGMPHDSGVASLPAYLRDLGVEVVDASPYLPTALDLAMALSQPILACAYLALALARGCRLVTADKAFVDAARRHPRCRDHVALLGEPLHAGRRILVSSGP